MSFIRKIIGLFLIIAAVGGLIFSIAGLMYSLAYRKPG